MVAKKANDLKTRSNLAEAFQEHHSSLNRSHRTGSKVVSRKIFRHHESDPDRTNEHDGREEREIGNRDSSDPNEYS